MKTINVLQISILTFVTVLPASTAIAQTEKGNWELALSGSFSHTWVNSEFDVDNSLDIYTGSLTTGYFFTRGLEAKLGLSVVGINGSLGAGALEGSANAWVVPVTLGLDYHFNTGSKFVPYLGGALGTYVVGAGFGEDWTAAVGVLADGHGGLKQFVKDNVAIDYRVSFQYIPLPDSISLNTVTFSIGLSFYF